MTDAEFLAWLKGYRYAHNNCGDFAPIIGVYRNDDGTVDRARTLDPMYFPTVAEAQRKRLLEVK